MKEVHIRGMVERTRGDSSGVGVVSQRELSQSVGTCIRLIRGKWYA
jgi:hypothetical protein